MKADPARVAAHQAFEDHFMACKTCTIGCFCPEGSRLKKAYDSLVWMPG